MYIARFIHGRLETERLHREKAEPRYLELAQTYRNDGYSLILYMPKHIEYECPKHRGLYSVYGIPCVALTMQNSTPEIPTKWAGHWTVTP